jgi:TctA family transporter
MKKLKYDAPPFILAFVLGPLLEYSLKQSLIFSKGSFMIFFTRPIAATGLTAAAVLLILPLLPRLAGRRPGATVESDIG